MEQKKPLEQVLWMTVIRIADLLAEFSTPDNAEKKYGDLSLRQLKAVKQVWYLQDQHPEGTTLKRLAEDLKLTPGTVSELVDSLVRRDLLARVQNPDDRREVRITLTKRSNELIHVSIDKMNAVCREFLRELPEGSAQSSMDSMNIMLNKLINIKERS